MLYVKQPVIVENGDPGITDYNMLIRADDALYNRAPKGSTPIYLLEESETGYDNLDVVAEEIYKVIRFQCSSQNDYWVSSTFSLDAYINDILTRLGEPVYKEPAWPDGILKEIVSDAPGGHANRCVVGRIRMTSTPAVTGACNEATPFIDSANVLYPEGKQFSFTYAMSILPNKCISEGYYMFSSDILQYLNDDPYDFRAYIGQLTINIWKDINNTKYNCNIVLSSYLYDMQAIELRYGAEATPTVYNTNDPNNTNQNNNNKGGNGDGDTGDDPVTVPVLPDSDMTEAGSIRIYAPTKAEIAALFNYLHSANIGDSIYKLWQNPIQGIVSLHYLPYPLTLKGDTKVSIDFVGLPTGVTAYAANQFQSINFGYCKIGNVKNNYLDYSPYTKIQIYLPGIGIRDVNTDDVMNKYIRVKYNCDNVTGQFVAFVLVGNTYTESEMSVKYTFSGCVAAPFPISQNNWGNTYIAAATLAAGALAGGVAAAGGAGAAAAGAGAGAGAAEAGAATAAGSEVTAASIGGNITNIGTAALQLAKPSITRAGTVSGTTSLFGVREPFLIIERPNQQDFKDFHKIKGYPCGKTFVLGDISGYNQIESIHLTGIQAMVEEINEIETLLKGGVIL